MNHPRVGIVALSLVLGVSVPARYAAGQAAQDKDRVCAQVQNRTPPVGSWASYNWTGGRSNGTTMRMAVVGQEPQDGKTYFWYEVTIADPIGLGTRLSCRCSWRGWGPATCGPS